MPHLAVWEQKRPQSDTIDSLHLSSQLGRTSVPKETSPGLERECRNLGSHRGPLALVGGSNGDGGFQVCQAKTWPGCLCMRHALGCLLRGGCLPTICDLGSEGLLLAASNG